MMRKLKMIPLDKICLDGDWPEDKTLTASIAAKNLLHPIHVCPDARPEHFMIVDGRRRVKSARALEWEKVEAFVYENEWEARHQITLAAQVHSENVLSDAIAIALMTEEEAYKIGGVNKAQYEAALCLLELLPELQKQLESGQLPVTAARKLCKLSQDDQRRALEIAEQANSNGRNRAKGPTVAQYYAAVREVKFEKQAALPTFEFAAPAVAAAPSGPNYLAIAGTLQRLAGECPDEILRPLLDWLDER